MPPPRIVVVADDLIWAERLARVVRAAGAEAVMARDLDGLQRALPMATAAIVDLTARAYDGLGAVGAAASAGRRVLAVAQHDDLDLHRRARASGAERVVAYRLLHERGADVVAAWLAGRPEAERAGRRPATIPDPDDAAAR